MKIMRSLVCLVVAGLFVGTMNLAAQDKDLQKSFKKQLEEHYEKQLVQVLVEGLYASLRPTARDEFIVYAHYPDSLPTNKNSLGNRNSQGDNSIDFMPFRGGSNPADLKFISGDYDGKTLAQASIVTDRNFLLKPRSSMRISSVDVNKRKIRLVLAVISPAYGAAKPGVTFDFYFDEDKVLKAGDYEAVVSEVSKFFELRE